MLDPGDIKYLVLADRAVPYLLGRVRWPDVAQALGPGSDGWVDDHGLFDLPYDPSAVEVSFAQAAAVAAGWGRQIHPAPVEDAPSYIRRMPANWSDLSPSERRTWGIEAVGRRSPASALRGLYLRAKLARTTARADRFLAEEVGPSVMVERRRSGRLRMAGRAHIRCEDATVTAGIVDLSERGIRCVLPEAPPLLRKGTAFEGPLLLEAETGTSRVFLDVLSQVRWHAGSGADTHFGLDFAQLDAGEAEGLQMFLAVGGAAA